MCMLLPFRQQLGMCHRMALSTKLQSAVLLAAGCDCAQVPDGSRSWPAACVAVAPITEPASTLGCQRMCSSSSGWTHPRSGVAAIAGGALPMG